MSYLDELNEQQRAAVEYCDGPQLIIAGAGSGKTRVLTYKIVHLLNQGHAPFRLLALTFTNKAATEMRHRIQALVGESVANQLWMGTFHSIFARILRRHAPLIGFTSDFTIYDTSDSRSLVKLIIRDQGLDDKKYKPANVHSFISNLKNNLITPSMYMRDEARLKADANAGLPMLGELYNIYCQRCRVANAMDFDDLLVFTNILLRDNPDVLRRYQEFFSYVLVDEYQDTNFAQHLIIIELSKLHRRVSVVGDDAQSIYSFRGANLSNILNMEHQFEGLKIFKLERNYRSTQNIINAANSLIDKNTWQIKKNIFTANKPGSRIPVIRCYSDYEEAFVVASQITSLRARTGCTYNDIAILYRTNAQSRVLEQALSRAGRKDDHAPGAGTIPYRIYNGTSFYERKEIKDAIAYFRLTVNHNDDEALRRIINFPKRGIGQTSLGKVQHAAVAAGVSMWQIISEPDCYGFSINKSTQAKLDAFVNLINGFTRAEQESDDAVASTDIIFDRTGLITMLHNDNTPENISQRENLEELRNAIAEFVEMQREAGSDEIKLSNFLAVTSLLTDQDENKKNGGDCVTLMTVHSAKGLEFRNVIIVGVEEDLFPSSMSKDSLAQIEEERRLLYVAITRAMDNCVITYATSRYRNGENINCRPSRFISDIDPQFLKIEQRQRDFDSFENNRFGSRNDFSQRKSPWDNIQRNVIARSVTNNVSNSTPRRRNDLTPTAAPSTPQPDNDGRFRNHTADELKEGMEIVHNRFLDGVIVNIDTSSADNRIVVDFKEYGSKTLLLKFAKFFIK